MRRPSARLGWCWFVPLLAACAGDGPPPVNSQVRRVDAGRFVDANVCAGSGVLCEGQTPYTCTNNTRTYQESCGGARPFCSPGNGCLACLPTTTRCAPEMPNVPQRCADDGSRWVDQPACEGEMRCSEGSCGDPCLVSDTVRPYLGCDYIASQTPNSQLAPRFQFAVVLSNPQTFPVTVQIRGGALDAMGRDLMLMPGAVETVTLPWVQGLVQFNPANPGCNGQRANLCRAAPPARSGVVRGGAYQIHATAPVAAYQFNPLQYQTTSGGSLINSFTNDASLLIARRALTHRYVVVTAPNWLVGRDPDTMQDVVLGGFIAVVATAGETTSVTVRLPPTAGVSTATNNVIQHDNLMPGDVAVIVGDRQGDLSGSTIEASGPVAVFVGHDCTQMPIGRVACDHLEEQLFPLEVLGREYVVSRLRDRASVIHVTRIVAPLNNTVVRFDPPSIYPPVQLNAREVLDIQSDVSFRISSSSPVAVAQFMVGQGPTGNISGDPAMVMEVPSQQFRSRYDFLVPDTYERNFLDVVAPRGSRPLLDGVPLGGALDRVGPWDVIHVEVRSGAHRLTTAEGVPLGVKVSGTAPYTSYMYPGGLDLRLLTPG
jgi:hypothetical protein